MPFSKASPVITGEGDRLRWWGHKNPLSKIRHILSADRLRALHVDLRHAKIACDIDDGLSYSKVVSRRWSGGNSAAR